MRVKTNRAGRHAGRHDGDVVYWTWGYRLPRLSLRAPTLAAPITCHVLDRERPISNIMRAIRANLQLELERGCQRSPWGISIRWSLISYLTMTNDGRFVKSKEIIIVLVNNKKIKLVGLVVSRLPLGTSANIKSWKVLFSNFVFFPFDWYKLILSPTLE